VVLNDMLKNLPYYM